MGPKEPARGQRPGTLTAVGVLLIIRGGLSIVIGLWALRRSSITGIFTVAGILLMPIGALDIYAGLQVLNLKEIGRQLGMILAGAGLVLGLILLAKFGAGVVGVLVDGFVIYALYANRQYFTA
ncbi:MAG: hypothetical protein ACJ77A_09335 [Actinomycetota bacterium]